jgi:site-specific DNA-methyltransferase (adenine-specific)
MTVRIEHDDCLLAIPRLVAEGVVCDAVVTDAPYHLVSVARGQTGGFMGQQWDGGDIAFRPETWAAIATILRPGGFLVAFGGTRTYHRLVCAIEDAGFVVQDQIAWMFGSGFPKRRDMLKPAFEPICLAYKPGGKRTMQVDECRVGTDESTVRPAGINTAVYGADNRHGMLRGSVDGRWPANVAHDGSDEVLAAFPETMARGNVGPSERHAKGEIFKNYGAAGDCGGSKYLSDSGSAARFFYSAKADKQDRWGSRHPTVKPIDLIRWLVRLVTPPGGLVLDPFAGSGTTGAAAFAEGRNAILIEREAEYIADIERRTASLESSVNQHSAVTRAVVREVKTRQRIEPMPVGGLFDRPYDESADLAGSYYAAVEEIGRRVKAGEPVPECMLKQKEP